jgi:hypothetical protein
MKSLLEVPRPSGEREGPAAQRWEGEGAASKASLLRQLCCGAIPSPADCVGTLSPLGRGLGDRT